ncbi:polymorphic toxin-type HINT domain-containing protein [Actinoplanes sp. NPDC051851]|uniref:polymorphic toxin-type HINT domain-containing protein n=1 Tax=Actinoplanes sp. NPDC051851 TaxID=3154753 RepID=UPI0034154B47
MSRRGEGLRGDRAGTGPGCQSGDERATENHDYGEAALTSLAFIPAEGLAVKYGGKLLRVDVESIEGLNLVASGCRAANSFDPKTRVLLADGTTKTIDDVEVGDEVLASDPEAGDTEAKEVTALHDNVDTDLVDLVVEDGSSRQSVVHTTQGHPFWSVDTSLWTDAGDLQPGDHLRSVDGAPVSVVAVHAFLSAKRMLNLP